MFFANLHKLETPSKIPHSANPASWESSVKTAKLKNANGFNIPKQSFQSKKETLDWSEWHLDDLNLALPHFCDKRNLQTNDFICLSRIS